MEKSTNEEVFISDAGFSKAFIDLTHKLNITKLSQLLEMNPEQILSLPGFSFNLLTEYRAYLAKNGLDYP